MIKKISYLFALINLLFLTSIQAQTKVSIDQVVAVVGKQIVLQSDIENQTLQMRAQGYYSSGDIKCEVFEEMLASKLLVNQAILDSVEVGDAEVMAEVERRMSYFISQIGSAEKFEQFYKKTTDEFRDEFKVIIREQMLASRMGQQVTAELQVTPQDVRSYFKDIPEDSLPIVNTQFELGQIILHPKIEETEILRVKDRLREFKGRVTNGDSFATLAVLYSEDPLSAKKGGDLGFFGRGDMVGAFSSVAFNLEIGEVSKVVKTEFGYHVIQCIEKQGDRINCRHILLNPKVSPEEKMKAQAKLDTIRTNITEGKLTFKEACWKYSDDEDTRLNGGLMVNPQSGDSKYEASQLEPKVAYAVSTLKVDDVSVPFESKDDKGRAVYRIVVLRSKTEPHPANLKNDYQVIQDLALGLKRQAYLEEWMKKKIKVTYLRIDNEYKRCEFENEAWNK